MKKKVSPFGQRRTFPIYHHHKRDICDTVNRTHHTSNKVNYYSLNCDVLIHEGFIFVKPNVKSTGRVGMYGRDQRKKHLCMCAVSFTMREKNPKVGKLFWLNALSEQFFFIHVWHHFWIWYRVPVICPDAVTWNVIKMITILPVGTWISVPNFIIHPNIVETFHSQPQMSSSWWSKRKSQSITKVIRIHCLDTMDVVVHVYTKGHSNSFHFTKNKRMSASCWINRKSHRKVSVILLLWEAGSNFCTKMFQSIQ